MHRVNLLTLNLIFAIMFLVSSNSNAQAAEKSVPIDLSTLLLKAPAGFCPARHAVLPAGEWIELVTWSGPHQVVRDSIDAPLRLEHKPLTLMPRELDESTEPFACIPADEFRVAVCAAKASADPWAMVMMPREQATHLEINVALGVAKAAGIEDDVDVTTSVAIPNLVVVQLKMKTETNTAALASMIVNNLMLVPVSPTDNLQPIVCWQ